MRSRLHSTDDSCGNFLVVQRGDLLTPLRLLRLTFCPLAIELCDLRTVSSEQFQTGDKPVFGRFTRDPAFSNGTFDQVQGKARIEDVNPFAVRSDFLDFTGEN